MERRGGERSPRPRHYFMAYPDASYERIRQTPEFKSVRGNLGKENKIINEVLASVREQLREIHRMEGIEKASNGDIRF